MALPLRLRDALAAVAVPFHGMGLCVAPADEASAMRARAEPDTAA
jgi:hypothetical protein